MNFFHRKSREQRIVDSIFKQLERDLGGGPHAAVVPLQGRANWRVVNAQTDMSVSGGYSGQPEVRLMVELVRTR